MTISLDPVETRVLGSLIEKDITTPDYYPLSLNALVNACNQRSNREPVMDLTEDDVRSALSRLEEKGLAGTARGSESRVAKFEHRMGEVLNVGRRETAVLCTLLLRGPQTPGELRGRSERLHRFEDLGEVQSALQRLIDRDPPLVQVLPRQPGTKEARYMDLFGGHSVDEGAAPTASASSSGADGAESALAEEVARLRTELDELRQQFSEFRKQFES